jgi:hypothetical protein
VLSRNCLDSHGRGRPTAKLELHPSVRVSALLDAIGNPALTPEQTDRLLRQLSYDDLISGVGMGDVTSGSIRLSVAGRHEVEQWLSEPDSRTEHLAVPVDQVFNIGTMNVTGTVLQGSTANNVTTSYGVASKELLELVAQFRQLLTAAELSTDDREGLEADLDALEKRPRHLSQDLSGYDRYCRRLKDALVNGALSGAELGAKQETIHLIEMAQKALPGGSG